MFKGSHGSRKYNKGNAKELRDDIDKFINEFLDHFDFTDKENSDSYDPFQEDIINLCNSNSTPGICDNFLENYCENRDRDEVSKSNVLSRLCGCYVSMTPEYRKYIDSRECDPSCHHSQTVQRADLLTGEIKRCSNTICVIDNISINTTESQTGSVNISQVCPGCENSENPCECIISGDIDKIKEETDLNINQSCGENAVCLRSDDNGNLVPIDCPKSEASSGLLWIIISIIAGIFLLVIVFIIFYMSK
jgi:hypothetical protein